MRKTIGLLWLVGFTGLCAGAGAQTPPSAAAVFAASAAARPPWPSLEAVPTIPGPIAQTTASNPPAAAHPKAEAAVTHSASPPKHAPADTVAPTRPRARSARRVSESGSGSAPPATWTYATRVPSSAAQTGATWLFKGKIRCQNSGHYGYTVRVLPHHANLGNAYEPGLVCWG